MTGIRETKLQQRGYDLTLAASPKAKYVSLKRVGNLLYSSGALPFEGDTLCSPGKVPASVNTETATKMAALATVNILRNIVREYGSLSIVKQVVRLGGFVNSESNFTNQHLIINGASELLLDVFEEAGTHARAAIGVAALPLNACVEIEVLFELTNSGENPC